MWINLFLTLYAVHIFVRQVCGIHFIELPGFQSDNDAKDPPTLGDRDSDAEKRFEVNIESTTKVEHKDEKSDWMAKEDPYPLNTEKQDNERHNSGKHGRDTNDNDKRYNDKKHKFESRDTESQDNEGQVNDQVRRYWLVTKTGSIATDLPKTDPLDKDAKLKEKISRLVEQTVHDTEQKIHSVEKIKIQYRDENPYKIGFILSMVKKSNDILNELFNLAVKHRHEWRALEQMKTFESIVHTNVDTTHLVRQLVEIHIQHLNSTKNDNNKDSKRRVVLL